MRDEIREFATAMDAKMAKHDSDRGDLWKRCDENALWTGLEREYAELWDSDASTDEWRDELLDVANFCMMLWHRLKDEEVNAKTEKCPRCGGSGQIIEEGEERTTLTCQKCHGTGRNDSSMVQDDKCEQCNGSGKVTDPDAYGYDSNYKQCPACGGTGNKKGDIPDKCRQCDHFAESAEGSDDGHSASTYHNVCRNLAVLSELKPETCGRFMPKNNCPRCGGSGLVAGTYLSDMSKSNLPPRMIKCPACGGTGKMTEEKENV